MRERSPLLPVLPALYYLLARFRDFRLYALARLVSTMAVQMQSVAIGWQV